MSKAFTDEESADSSVVGRPIQRANRGEERPMTVDGHRALLDELKRLTDIERPALKASSAFDAEARVKELEHRVALIAATLESVRVVPATPGTGQVRFGSTVSLRWSDGREQRLRLVGPDETDVKQGLVSIESPLARGLIGREVGDEVEVERPRGVETATVLLVEN